MSRTGRAYRYASVDVNGDKVPQSPPYVTSKPDVQAAARRRFLRTSDRFNDYGDE